MKRYLLVGGLVLIGVLLALAPASLLKKPLAAVPDLSLQPLTGTLWQGRGQLSATGTALGQLQWQAQPGRLLSAQLAASYDLTGPELQLNGVVARGLTALRLTAQGQVAAGLINQLLADYELSLSGALDAEGIEAELVQQTLTSLSGQVLWAGGRVSYPLEGRQASQLLPPMQAQLSLDEHAQPLATVYSDGVNFPLLTLRILESGFVKISLTRRFTQIVGMPWPGSEPDHAVVLEVEQQVF